MVFFNKKQKGKTMQPSHFENTTLQMLQEILDKSPIRIEPKENQQYDVFSTETNECIFRLVFDKNYEGNFRLEINGELVNLYPSTIYTLRGNVVSAYRKQEKTKEEAKKQSNKEKVDQKQQATLSFLSGFTPDKGRV